MAPHRRYTKREKLATVMAADIVGVTAAAESSGIPHQTVSYWMNDPKFGEIRRKTREDLADEIKVAAHMAWQRVIEAMPTMEPRDAIFAAEKATSLQILMTGGATARTESRDISDLPDSAYVDAIHEFRRITERSGADPDPAPAEEPTG